ncbi:MAG: patatin family protein [Lachnospiraceae bacterium]|nr:patatin family protein [Lachnospiraceae bacterium]
MKKGLILEGGAMRGMFTCGVMDVFMENGITFDGAAGISAGAIFGCNYKSGQIGRGVRYNKKYGQDKRYCSLKSLIKTGDLYGAEFCYETLPNELDIFDRDAFAANPMEFYIGATNIETAETEYHKCSDGGDRDLLWMRASGSMPVVSRPVNIDGKLYLDGGITDPVPLKFMESIGYNRNVIVLTQPDGYMKEKSSSLPVMRIALKDYPKTFEAMAKRHMLYNAQMKAVKRREEKGYALVVRPPESLGISRTENDPDELERVYQIGRTEGEKRLEDVKRFLEKA